MAGKRHHAGVNWMVRTFLLACWLFSGLVGFASQSAVTTASKSVFASSVGVYLNPNTGRFWSMDLFAGHKNDPLSLNKFIYCRNNVINRIDPSGYEDIGSMMLSMGISVSLDTLPRSGVSGSKVESETWPWLELSIDEVRLYDASTHYGLSLDNMDRDIEKANVVYQQAHVKLVKGDKRDYDVDETAHIIGGDYALNVRLPGNPPTSDEVALTKPQREDRFTAYYVGEFEGMPSLYGRAAYPAFYLKYAAPSATFAHELGHNLMQNENHHYDETGADNLMSEDYYNSRKCLLTIEQCRVIRQSKMFAK